MTNNNDLDTVRLGLSLIEGAEHQLERDAYNALYRIEIELENMSVYKAALDAACEVLAQAAPQTATEIKNYFIVQALPEAP